MQGKAQTFSRTEIADLRNEVALPSEQSKLLSNQTAERYRCASSMYRKNESTKFLQRTIFAVEMMLYFSIFDPVILKNDTCLVAQ